MTCVGFGHIGILSEFGRIHQTAQESMQVRIYRVQAAIPPGDSHEGAGPDDQAKGRNVDQACPEFMSL